MKLIKRVFFAFLFLAIILFGALILPQTAAACGESVTSNKVWDCWDTGTNSWSSSDDSSGTPLTCASTQGIGWTPDEIDGNCFHYTGSCQENLDCQIPHQTPQFVTYSGTVYVDTNGNGSIDAEDEKKSNATVILWEFTDSTVSSDPQLRTKKSETTTGGDGTYRFYVTPGDYDLELVVPEGYGTTTANPISAPLGDGMVNFLLVPLSPFYPLYPYGFYGSDNPKAANSCVDNFVTSDICADKILLKADCTFNGSCGHTIPLGDCTNGYSCAKTVMKTLNATCSPTSQGLNSIGNVINDYTNTCNPSNGKYYGMRFYIPPPSTSTPTLTVNPTSIPLIGSLVYSFTGFGPSEIVDVWVVNSPTGYTLHKTADASGNGTDTISNLSEPAGSWILKARGTSSGRSAEANFTIVDSASTTTPTACPTLTAPIGLKCNYNKISWNPVAGADRYPVRVDSAPVSWAATTSCDVIQNPDACVDNVFTNFQDYTFTPGINYHVWVHAVNDCGASSSPAESWSAPAEITCDGSAASAPINPITPPSSSNIGSIIDLNVGVTNNAIAWIQSVGSDIRWDSGFTNPLPQGKYASLKRSNDEMPGIIFSGALNPSFGSGKASENPFNWQVGGSTDVSREVFTDTHSLIPTSYRFLWETAQSSGITPTAITNIDHAPGCDECDLEHGIYKVDGNLNIDTDYTFGPGNFIILINGNLNINRKIRVPVGSTAIFSASGNIIVSSTVGEGVLAECNIATHEGCSIEGLYSADRSFVAEKNVCTGNQQRLNIAGSVIANAGRRGGSFVNKRTLCANNATYPSVSFVERPDFMLNYPSMVTQTTRAWQEVAP